MPGQARRPAKAALKLMDKHLERAATGSSAIRIMTLADVCLFAYTHVADEADFDLHLYPRVRNWIERIKGQPHYVPIDA